MKQKIVIEIEDSIKRTMDIFGKLCACDLVRSNASMIAEAIRHSFPFRPEMINPTQQTIKGKTEDGKYLLETEDPGYLVKISIGKWLHRNDDHNDWLECSLCGYGSEGEVKYGEGTNFCPHCGADMRDRRQQS